MSNNLLNLYKFRVIIRIINFKKHKGVKKNIVIVGFGVGGPGILKTIIDNKNYNDKIKIHIFEKNGQLAVGLAYAKDTDYKLLNVHERYISLNLDNPNHFKDWLKGNNIDDKKIEGMIPRIVFASY